MRFQTNSKYLTEDIHLLESLSLLDTSHPGSKDFEKAQEIICSELKALGLCVQKIGPTSESSQPLIMAENIVDNPDWEISLISHLDTVLPPRELHFKGDELWGSGVADNKGGVVCALRFLKNVLPLTRVRFRFICSPSEETGSLGWHEHFKQWGKTSDFVFGFEPAQNANLIDQRNGNRWYQVQVQGVGAHAGRMNEPCVNAGHEACHKISAISALNDPAQYVKANVAQISGGGGSFNRTCESVSFKVDTRFPNFEQREELHANIEKILFTQTESCFVSGQTPRCFYSLEDDCPPMAKNSRYDFVTKRLLEILEEIEGREVKSSHSGGAADINYFGHAGNYGLDGLGPVGSGLHTEHEMIQISSLETRPQALATFFHEWIHDRHTQGVLNERTIACIESLEL